MSAAVACLSLGGIFVAPLLKQSLMMTPLPLCTQKSARGGNDEPLVHHAVGRAAWLLGLGNVEIKRLATWLAPKWTQEILDRTPETFLLLGCGGPVSKAPRSLGHRDCVLRAPRSCTRLACNWASAYPAPATQAEMNLAEQLVLGVSRCMESGSSLGMLSWDLQDVDSKRVDV